MKGPNSVISRTLTDVIGTGTSKERLKQHLRTPLYRNALYLMANSAVMAFLGLVFWIAAARFYSAQDVGLASATIGAASLLALLSTLGMDYGLIRFLPNSGEGSNAMINSCLTIGGLVSIIIALIFIAGLDFWSPGLLFVRKDLVFLSAFVIFTAAWTLYILVGRTFVAGRRAGFTLGQGASHSLLKLALLILVAGFSHSFGIFASWGISIIVAVGIGMLLFLPKVQAGYIPLLAIRREVVNEMVYFSFVNYIAAFLWDAPRFILPLMVVNLLGAESNAYFYTAWVIATLLCSISVGTSFSLFAEGSYDEQRLSQDTRRSLKLVFLLLIPAIVLMFLIGDKILLLFGGAYSENATKLLWIVALSALPSSVNAIYFSVKRVEMRIKRVVGLTAFIAVATLALSWVLLPQMGILAVGVSWLASQGVVAMFTMRSLLQGCFEGKVKHA